LSSRIAKLTLALPLLSAPFMAQAGPAPEQQSFYAALLAQCDQRYVGESTFPEDPGDDWRGKQLVVTFERCDEEEIRMPLAVGDDRSRTWVLRPVEGGLELKHDHRHEDGTPHEVTQYGGTTINSGSPSVQTFPADSFTAEMIPEAETNVWSISLSENGALMTYYLERHAAPRFEAVLSRQ